MSETLLEVRNLRKSFTQTPPIEAVSDISFAVSAGEIVGLLGPNGAGKTTTIRMLLSTLKPSSGEIYYFGKSLFSCRSEVLQQVAFASTYTNLPLFLTVEENLHTHGLLYGMKRALRKQRMHQLLSYFDMYELRHRYINQLSAGQRTRVMLVKAFLPSPKVVLLDEPTASLDPDIAEEVRKFVRWERDQNNTAILFSSHNMAEVAHLCDRVVFLRDGRIVAQNTPVELAASVGLTTLALGVESGDSALKELLERRGLVAVQEDGLVKIDVRERELPELISQIAKAGVSFSRIAINHPTLEQYFIKQSRQGGG